jgi:excisionase family DNA binding protein
MTTREQTPSLLTTGEVATALRITSQTVRNRVADGTLRSVRIGDVIRIPAAEVTRLLEGTQNKAAS